MIIYNLKSASIYKYLFPRRRLSTQVFTDDLDRFTGRRIYLGNKSICNSVEIVILNLCRSSKSRNNNTNKNRLSPGLLDPQKYINSPSTRKSLVTDPKLHPIDLHLSIGKIRYVRTRALITNPAQEQNKQKRVHLAQRGGKAVAYRLRLLGGQALIILLLSIGRARARQKKCRWPLAPGCVLVSAAACHRSAPSSS